MNSESFGYWTFHIHMKCLQSESMEGTVLDDKVAYSDVSMPISMVFRKLHRTNVEPTKDDSPDSHLFCKSTDNVVESNRKCQLSYICVEIKVFV